MNGVEKLTEAEIKLIYLYAGNNMRTTAAANAMKCNRKTIALRFINIEQKTGYNPQRFFELVKIMEIIEEEGQVTKKELLGIVTDAVAEKDKEIAKLKAELKQSKQDFDWLMSKLKDEQEKGRKRDWLITEVVENASNSR